MFLSCRPGMIALVAEKVAEKGMSVENLTTELRIGKNQEREFVINLLVSSPDLKHKENIDQCIVDISTLKEELALTHFDIRVHMD